MQEAKIVHFEDDPNWRRIVRYEVEDTAHKVVADAADLPSSLAVLDQMRDGEVEADVVILGGNLSERSLFQRAAGDDPRTIVEGIRERGLRVRTIGLAGLTMEEYGVKVDVDLTKLEAVQLGETLDRLEAVASSE